MRINRNVLKKLYIDNPIFKKIIPEFQAELMEVMESHTYNLALVEETRVGVVFFRYLKKVKRINLEPYTNDLLLFLQLIAALNKRKEIIESDLHLLHKIDLDEGKTWQKVVRNTVAKTVFREYYLYLDQNSIFKDQLTVAFYNHTITNAEIDLTHEIMKWLEESIEKLSESEHDPNGLPQLVNRFYQQEIYLDYHEQLERILQIMNFQLRAFKLVDTY